ncbi:MAG: ABC transporter ATP-binding protein [Hyphomicrobium denitrificans]|uniref:Spermidine/putrescine import ATP-binding protein PotA n=1 Tax=Hyphomicrobium denitrificans (strain ATCC 51888 / DSM 1869 / NCIMB 11706 / TK 0415) TaxID=582899 RepID=D8JXA2_HYPDA|nr:ABC transporter ATP-binding protein [Hyphomicrobium denitrificans]ADJ23238.1 spermidine/putrescine ABC transporter ATPase subunit [Hyphomicrobium denitrificans ATCC 51888]MBN9290496.1 ABC transporter ATP-binding protein [Hyphomicrobium denitrificans]
MTVGMIGDAKQPGAGPQRAGPRTAAPQSGFAPWKDPNKSSIVRFENVTKKFDDFVAVNNVTLDIYEREFFALLGPSGCGKSTLLRMLAGFEMPTDGRTIVAGQDITNLPPYERPVNMMFQSYALFPHMTVEGNIGFGLRQEGMAKDKIAERVDEAMTMLELRPFAKRKPNQLSGGQQQRVALARAIAKKPRIVLLDEPLGALDKKLRQQAQFELMRIQETTGTTFIIVTHDQEEAMTVASRIAVMDKGELVQVATPGDIYENPKTRYIAGFIGDVNVFEGKVSAVSEGCVEIDANDGYKFKTRSAEPVTVGQQVWLALRPEKIRIAHDKPASPLNAIPGKVEDIGYLGSISHYHVRTAPGERVTALRANAAHAVERTINWEEDVWLDWPVDAGVVLTR